VAVQVSGSHPPQPILRPLEGRKDELEADPAARQAYREAVATGTLPPEPVWASEAIDLITEVSPAAELVGALAAQAEQALVKAVNQ
jgi:nitronate monooxygenase